MVGTVLFDMVTAIIIDSFNAMREKATMRAKRMSNWCFLRNIHREKFDQMRSKFGRRGTFNENRDDEMLVNYLLLLGHIRTQNESELTALESHVRERMCEGSAEWIPNGNCWVLQQLEMQGDHN